MQISGMFTTEYYNFRFPKLTKKKTRNQCYVGNYSFCLTNRDASIINRPDLHLIDHTI